MHQEIAGRLLPVIKVTPRGRSLLLQLHVPIGKIEKVLPMLMARTIDHQADDRSPLRLRRFAPQAHRCLVRQSIRLSRIALNAGTDDVFPSRPAPVMPGNDVIQVQVFAIKNLPAVLATVAISLKDIVPGQLQLLAR